MLGAVQIFAGLVDAVVPVFTAILEAVLNFGTELLNLFTAIFQGDIPAILSTIPGVFGSVFEGARAVASAALNGILGIVRSIVDAISSISFSGLSSAVSNAQAQAYSGASTAVAAIPGHAAGGIYPRGAHLTWFAEKSAEAAIPLDRSNRSVGLWTQVGQMMGILPTKKPEPPDYVGGAARRSKTFEAIERARLGGSDKRPSMMSAPRVKLPFNLPIPLPNPKKAKTPGVPPEVREPKGELTSAAERNEELTREEATFERESTTTSMTPAGDLPPIMVNVTFNGAVDREETKSGVMEGLEEALARLTHEKARRAYA